NRDIRILSANSKANSVWRLRSETNDPAWTRMHRKLKHHNCDDNSGCGGDHGRQRQVPAMRTGWRCAWQDRLRSNLIEEAFKRKTHVANIVNSASRIFFQASAQEDS